MKAVLQTIRILVITQLIETVRCQDGFSNQDILRLQQMASNEGQIESITSYSTNVIQRDPNSQSVSSVSLQYQMTDEANNDDYNRADHGRSRKVYRIKNPFQRQLEDDGRQDTNNQDSDTGASNQYASMQYSLPPEEFLQQMRAENQLFQQQQQVSTQAPNIGYTATPQPQYQYSTIAASGYDNNNQQLNQVPQLEPKMSQSQNYRPISNIYQYNGPNSYGMESVQSTPSPIPPYLSTSSAQYVGTPANSYVSSSSPIYLSSPPNMQQYVSSQVSAVQAGTPDYNNKVTSTIGSNSLNYDNNDLSKKLQIDHYDNSGNGMRYPVNGQQQYQSEYPNSTPSPTSSPYSVVMRDQWQNAINAGANSVSKSLQEVSLSQYQKYPYNRNQQDSRPDQNSESSNNEIHRIGNLPSANNLYLNFVQPDYQAFNNNLRSRTRDAEQETGQPEFYSHGEYGWKLSDRKPSASQNLYSSANYPRYQALSAHPEGAVSQMSFHMDTSRPHNYDQTSKSSPENSEAQEFAKAAAKAHDNLKRQQQLYGSEYATSFNTNSQSSGFTGNNFYGNNDKQRNKAYADSSSANPFLYSNTQQDLITASPYYYINSNSKENALEDKSKQPFDHDKALKNIVPIDVSNVVNENQQKISTGSDNNNNRYSFQNYVRDQLDQSQKQNYKSITDAFYQDKNTYYGFHIKPKQDELATPENLKQSDPNFQFYSKQPSLEQFYTHGTFSDNKRYGDGTAQTVNYHPQVNNNYQDSVQSPANIQQQGLQRPQNQMSSDIANILKLNDIPYRLTQSLPAETFRFYNNNYEQVGLPTPLPVRLNQNVGTHQLDVAANILNKLVLNKQQGIIGRPETEPQSGLSTINGFKVANPFNVDLNLVAEMLKGKSAVDDSQLYGLRDQFNKPAPIKLDISQLQQLLLKNDNNVNLASLNDGLGAYSSPYFDIFSSGRHPYQGVKYSRSQEEEESIVPIADSSNNHPIGAVMEQEDSTNGHEVNSGAELTAQDEDNLAGHSNYGDERKKNQFRSGHRAMVDRHRHPNSLISGRYPYQRKHPKSDVGEPYPLLKPPPPHSPRSRGHNIIEKHTRRRRVKRPKVLRVLKTEPLFEAGSDDNVEDEVPRLLRPPPPIAEAKSDVIEKEPTA